MNFSIIDNTKTNRPPAGFVDALKVAMSTQLNQFTTDWPSIKTSHIAVGGAGMQIQLVDTLDVQGALGYHETDAQGNPIAYIGCSTILHYGGTWESGATSVSQCVSHETLEMAGDLFANMFGVDNSGRAWAWEMCDAVESDFYTLGGIAVSNYLLPAYFDPGHAGPFDKMKHLAKGFTVGKGGYAIVAALGQERQIFGEQWVHAEGDTFGLVVDEDYPAWKRELKFGPTRTMKRLALGR